MHYGNVYDFRLHKCTEVLLAALVNREVCSKSSLMEVWKEDKKCKQLLPRHLRIDTYKFLRNVNFADDPNLGFLWFYFHGSLVITPCASSVLQLF